MRAVHASALALALAGCGRTPQASPTPPPRVTLYGVTVRTYRGSKLALRGTADRLDYFRATGDATAQRGFLHLLSREGLPQTYDLAAPEVTGNVLDQQALATGGVTLRGQGGLKGKTPSAHFDGAKLLAFGTQPIVIRGPRYAVQAGGFTFSLAHDELAFHAPVHSLAEEQR